MTEAGKSSENEGADTRGISIETASKVVLASEAPLKVGIIDEHFCAALNHLVAEITVLSLSRDTRSARKEIDRLERAFQSYQRLAEKLPSHGLFPPKPPADWRAAVTLWILNTKADLNSMKIQGRTNDLSPFYPRAIGLFNAAFQSEITIWHDGGDNSSPLVKFAEAVINSAREAIDLDALAGQARVESKELLNPWRTPTRDAIRVGLQNGREKMPVEGAGPLGADGYEGPRQPIWLSYSGMFASMLKPG